MIKKIENNCFFLLLIISFVFICIANNTVDNDIWLLLNNGKYIMNYGFPLTDPFSLHDSLNYLIQQWLTSCIFYNVYSMFGRNGLLILLYLISFLLIFAYYKLSYLLCNSRRRAVIITTLTFIFINAYIVHRPQIFTYLILIIELLFLELYVKKNNKRYLFILPFLSFLLINLHSSMWCFQFIFMLPFVVNSINIEGVTIDRIRLKPLIVVIVFMVIAGLVNPYGYQSLLYIFKSYGMSEINNTVGEMKAINFGVKSCRQILACLFLLIFICNLKNDLKLDVRHFLFVCGTTVLAFMHAKGFPYFIIAFFYSLSYLIKDLNIEFNIKYKFINAFIYGIKLGLMVMLPLTFFVTIYYSITEFSFGNYSEGDIIDYIADNYNTEKVRLYVDFNNGSYAEYLGIKSYIDGRAELYFKKFNGKNDIFKESINIYNNEKNFDYEKFVNKYEFTHLIVNTGTYFEEYLDSNDNYEVVYEQYFDSAIKNVVVNKLYALKSENLKKA